MSATDIFEQLAAAMASPKMQEWNRSYAALLARLSEGAAIPPREAAALLGWPESELEDRLSRVPFNVERDAEGGVIGAGLTLRPTPHEFVVEGRRLFTWCALDALIFPAVLGKIARVTSPCASTGRGVSMTVTPNAVSDVHPADASMSLVAPKGDRDIRQSFCCHVHFLASREAGARYGADHPDALVLGVHEVFPIAQRLAQLIVTSAGAKAPLAGKG